MMKDLARETQAGKKKAVLECFLSSVADSASDGIMTINLKGIIQSWNPAAERLFGVPREQIIGKAVTKLFGQAEHQKISALLRRIKRSGAGEPFQMTVRAKEGRREVLLITVFPVPDFSGNLTAFSLIARDITESKRAEPKQKDLAARTATVSDEEKKRADELEVEQRKLEEAQVYTINIMTDLRRQRAESERAKDYIDNIVKSMADTLIVMNPDGTIQMANQATLNLLGYEEQELIGKPISVIFAEENVPFKGPGMNGITKEDSIRNVELTFCAKDRHRISMSFSGSVMKDGDGKLLGVVCVAKDLTKLKQIQEDLRVSRESFRTIVGNVGNGIFVVDDAEKVVYANASLGKILSVDAKALIGQMFPMSVKLGTMETVDIVTKDGTPGTGEMYVQNTLWEGRSARFVVLRDITERKRAEERERALIIEAAGAEADREKAEELEKAYKDVRRMNERLEIFARAASHDLKEPVRSLINFSEMLRKKCGDRLDQVESHYLDVIIDSGGRMRRLIDDLLKLSRIVYVKATESVNVNTVVDEVLQDLSVLVQERKAIVKVNRLPTALVNRVQIRAVFQNLITNAIKHNNKTRLELTVGMSKNMKENKSQQGHWTVYVRDNGKGIDPKYQEKIFELFERLDRDNPESTGVGLAIVKRIVETMGGAIWVKSKLGEGATFFFTIPKNEQVSNDRRPKCQS
jgi:PAS domain S-box-containing protein